MSSPLNLFDASHTMSMHVMVYGDRYIHT